MSFEIDTLVHYYEILLQRLEDLEGQMQQVRARDISPIDVKVGSFTCPAATGYKAITGVGFKPRYIDFKIAKAADTINRVGIGFTDYNGNQNAVAWASIDTTQFTRIAAVSCIFLIKTDGDSYVVGKWISMDEDGFTINFTAVESTYTIQWKACR